MKVQILVAALAVLLLCTACAEVVAAPGPTPTPVPLPISVGTPDATWSAMCAELEENLGVCLLTSTEIEATLLAGPVMVAKLIFADEDLNFYVLEVGVEKDEVVYETFVVRAERNLSDFDRVFVYIAVGNREWEFGFPVAFCPRG